MFKFPFLIKQQTVMGHLFTLISLWKNPSSANYTLKTSWNTVYIHKPPSWRLLVNKIRVQCISGLTVKKKYNNAKPWEFTVSMSLQSKKTISYIPGTRKFCVNSLLPYEDCVAHHKGLTVSWPNILRLVVSKRIIVTKKCIF